MMRGKDNRNFTMKTCWFLSSFLVVLAAVANAANLDPESAKVLQRGHHLYDTAKPLVANVSHKLAEIRDQNEDIVNWVKQLTEDVVNNVTVDHSKTNLTQHLNTLRQLVVPGVNQSNEDVTDVMMLIARATTLRLAAQHISQHYIFLSNAIYSYNHYLGSVDVSMHSVAHSDLIKIYRDDLTDMCDSFEAKLTLMNGFIAGYAELKEDTPKLIAQLDELNKQVNSIVKQVDTKRETIRKQVKHVQDQINKLTLNETNQANIEPARAELVKQANILRQELFGDNQTVPNTNPVTLISYSTYLATAGVDRVTLFLNFHSAANAFGYKKFVEDAARGMTHHDLKQTYGLVIANFIKLGQLYSKLMQARLK